MKLCDCGCGNPAPIAKWTPEQWIALKAQFGNRCLGCKKTEEQLLALGRKLVPDHVQSLAGGGRNDISNLQPMCHGIDGCNNKKHIKHVDHRGVFSIEFELPHTTLITIPTEGAVA